MTAGVRNADHEHG